MSKKTFILLTTILFFIISFTFFNHYQYSNESIWQKFNLNKAKSESKKEYSDLKNDYSLERNLNDHNKENKSCPCLFSVIPDAVENSLPSVVSIVVSQIFDKKQSRPLDRNFFFPSPFGDMFKDFFDIERPKKVEAQGSGFIIRNNDGNFYIVTNYHVISDANDITIYRYDKTKFKAELLAHDSKSDIAILKIKDQRFNQINKDYLEWGDSKNIRVGQSVIAIGNPFGLGSTVTSGIISSKGRDIPNHPSQQGGQMVDLIQHSAQINVGSSGGVLLSIGKDKKQNKWVGEVIGINTAIFAPPGGGNVGVGFAIPSNVAKSIVEQLLKHGKAIYGFLGIMVQKLDEEQRKSLGLKQHGFYVNEVVPNSPAAKGGIKPDDIILEYDHQVIGDKTRINELVEKTPIGKVIDIKILRSLDKPPFILKVKIEERKDDSFEKSEDERKEQQEKCLQGINILGMRITQIPEGFCKRFFPNDSDCDGVFVSEIDENTPNDLERYDVIQQINKIPVKSPKEFASIVKKMQKENKNIVMLKIKRRGIISNLYPTISLPQN